MNHKSNRYILRNFCIKNNIKCAYCNKSYNKNRRPSIDHIRPRVDGGTLNEDNIVLACTICNQRKNSLSIQEYILKYPKSKYFLKIYLSKIKKLYINNKSYYESIKWIEQYLKETNNEN